MTIQAYSDLYLNDAMLNLANAFDYGINVCEIEADDFSFFFSSSKYSRLFEMGNPSIISGRSGIELARDILREAYPEKALPEPELRLDRTPEYWAGWSLAGYQQKYTKRFKEIFQKIPLSSIIAMYPIYHEMDLERFYEAIEKVFDDYKGETKLKKYRRAAGLSQKELSLLSHVSLRSIQLYEERVNDIDKAEARSLFRLSVVLHCQIEDLLERPERF